jgi:DNA-binding NtrC family response regulator
MRSSRSQFSVLLISDDDRMQRMASWILLEEGYYVAVCSTATDAVKHDPPLTPDVILIDARDRIMKDETHALRSAFPRARIAALHFHGAPAAEHVDAECHLHTPFHADELIECVENALGSAVGSTSVHVHA